MNRLSLNLDTLFSSPDDVRACTEKPYHHPFTHVYAHPLHVLISGGREAIDVGENSRSRIFVTARAE